MRYQVRLGFNEENYLKNKTDLWNVAVLQLYSGMHKANLIFNLVGNRQIFCLSSLCLTYLVWYFHGGGALFILVNHKKRTSYYSGEREKTTMTVQQELTSTNHHKDDETVSFELMKDGMYGRLVWTVLLYEHNVLQSIFPKAHFKWRIQSCQRTTELRKLCRFCDDPTLLNTWYFSMHGHKTHAHARRIQLCSSQETWSGSSTLTMSSVV